MRTTLKWARASMAAVFFVTTCVGDIHAADFKGKPEGQVGRDSVLRIPGNAAFPLSKRIDLGVGRSIVVQFPVPLKDVLVSDPAMLDAVVQSSDRVFLIAKKTGQTNAFFFDEYGQQILTLEVAVGADLSTLDQLLTRLIPGSNVHSEIAGRALVLTGTVRTPIDSNRAAQIAAQFAAANADSASIVTGPSLNSTTNTATTTNIGRASIYQSNSDSNTGPAPGGNEDVYARQAGDQSARRRRRRASDAARQRRRGAAHDPEAVRRQRRRVGQLRQLHHRHPQREQAAAERRGARFAAHRGLGNVGRAQYASANSGARRAAASRTRASAAASATRVSPPHGRRAIRR